MAIVSLRKLQLPLDRLEVRLLAQWIHERIGLQFHQPRITQSHRGVEPLRSFSGDLHQARYHERDDRAHLVSVQDVSSEHTHAPPAKHARRSQLGGASHSGATAHLRFHLTFDEGKQIGVHLFGVSDRYTVRATWVNLKNCVRDDRWYAAAGWADRHDLVVFAVNDE